MQLHMYEVEKRYPKLTVFFLGIVENEQNVNYYTLKAIFTDYCVL